ncbi:metallophosphoesterase [Rhodococcus sp. NPDC056960]|uniref:metallophosphoesterase n=1 Tax=Rhodococcus sp. NPDC056960 TaxID=3345982 RepID=UPI00362A5EC4
MTNRVAVIGDIGGHADELRTELGRLGVDENGRLPSGLVVIQVGDLIHRGPKSDRVVAMVDGYLKSHPTQWIQLIGNHETHYLRPPQFKWTEKPSRRTLRTIRSWWTGAKAHVAVAVQTPAESFLITHAGVTYSFWRDVLDAAPTAALAAERINRLARADDDRIHRCGALLGANSPDLVAGPIWADSALELIPSWTDKRKPFSQIHGHTTVVDWRDTRAEELSSTPGCFHRDFVAKHEIVDLAGGRLIGVDPGHLSDATQPWSALVLPFAEMPRVSTD